MPKETYRHVNRDPKTRQNIVGNSKIEGAPYIHRL